MNLEFFVLGLVVDAKPFYSKAIIEDLLLDKIETF
jgi:hypothetical protein